jgi:hypothetical protein
MIWRLKCLLLAATPFRYSVITGSAGFVGGAHTQGKRQGVSARQARELRQAAAGRAAESSQGRGHSRQTLVTAAPTVVRAIAIRGAMRIAIGTCRRASRFWGACRRLRRDRAARGRKRKRACREGAKLARAPSRRPGLTWPSRLPRSAPARSGTGRPRCRSRPPRKWERRGLY